MWRSLAIMVGLVVIGGCVTSVPVALPSGPAVPAPRLDTRTQRRAAFARAYTHWRHGEHAVALPTFTTLVDAYPELADYALYFVGTIAAERMDNATATTAFARLLADYPQSVKAPAAALGIGKVLLRTERVDVARRYLETALSAPDTATADGARLALAEADERLGNPNAAYAAYMAVRRASPGSSLGRAAADRALALRTRHPDLMPTGAALLSEAKLLLAEHDYRAAEHAAEELLVHPEGVELAAVWRVQADAAYGRGEVDASLAQLRALVDRYPSSEEAPGALLRLASVRWNRDQDDAALTAFAEFQRRYPEDHRIGEAIYATGRIHQSAGRDDRALDSFAALVMRYPGSKFADDARWRIGWIRYVSADWPAAADAFARLARVSTSAQVRSGARYWEARALERDGHVAAARDRYEQLLTTEPTDYYAMWAERRMAASAAPLLAPDGASKTTAALADTAAAAMAVGPPPIDTFHFGRWEELKAAGVFTLARDELKAVEHERADDVAVMRYLLRAYPAVDGFAAAQRLLGRLGGAADLPDAARQRVLYPLAFWTIVTHAAASHALDPFLVEAVMRQESRFDPQAQSPAQAYGLMQLLPQTATRVAANGRTVAPAALVEPELNIDLGTRYLTQLLDRYAGNVLKALAAYNGGEGAVGKWERRFGDLDLDEFVESISYRETRDYVKRVMTNYRAYRRLYVEPAG
ncbi:MAG: transglycosylase SLT domain-containing protein [Candidatus Binatia bacterium]